MGAASAKDSEWVWAKVWGGGGLEIGIFTRGEL